MGAGNATRAKKATKEITLGADGGHALNLSRPRHSVLPEILLPALICRGNLTSENEVFLFLST